MEAYKSWLNREESRVNLVGLDIASAYWIRWRVEGNEMLE